ncbi:MAG TPA: Ig-like domain-containing protein [Verrucomicrobiae bacterium]|nr:Ig-like domain-containing protein [Verrucomicrobiae bacterium]
MKCGLKRLLYLPLVVTGALIGLAVTPKLLAADMVFAPGAYIIDMGQLPQTPANALKPYGMIYDLVVNNLVPVYWAINPNKITDKNPAVTIEGADFAANGKTYRGGPFIIAAEQVTASVTNVIALWRAKGVVVDGPITNGFTAPIYNDITSFPNTLLDSQNGSLLIKAFYTPAEVPASSYHLGSPVNLTVCDDLYAMPHSDPENWSAATKAAFQSFVLQGGSFWASCHSVSAMEAAPPTYCGFNFLTKTSLVPWGSHNNANTVPFVYNTNTPAIWADPLMQFMGKVDLALQGGSEEIYVPDGNGWGPQANVAVFDNFYASPAQPWISHANPSMAAAEVVFGRAYNNPAYGSVLYVTSHSFQADGTAQNTAVARMFGNQLLSIGIERRPRVTVNVPDLIHAGETVNVSATVTGRGGPHSILWVSSVGGTFGDATATNTTYTAPLNASAGASVLRVLVNDSCNRSAFDAEVVNILPATGPALYKTASWTNSPGPVQAGDQIDYQLKMADYTNQFLLSGVQITDYLPPNTSYKAASASPALSSGPDPLVWNLGTNTADIPGLVNGIVTNTFSATTNTLDTYIDKSNNNKNYGGATNLVVSGDAGHEKRTLVRFDLSALPTNTTIVSANLVLTKIGGTATAARNISIHRLTNDWTENTLNNANGEASWNKRKTGVSWKTPGGDFVAAGERTNSVGTANGSYTWNVTGAISNSLVAPGAAATNGFLLRYNIAKLPNDTVIFGSSENAAGNGPKLVVVSASGIATTTRITTSPYLMIGSQASLPTVDVTMQVTVIGNPTNLTVTAPTNLAVVATAGATVTKQASYPSPTSAIVRAGGGTVTFTYKYDVTGLGTAPGSFQFTGKPADAGGVAYATATSGNVLTVPTLNYSVLVNAPLPPLVQHIPNTATFSDDEVFEPGINDVTSAEVLVPVNNSNPNIGVAKALTSMVNLGDGRFAVSFDLAVTNLGSVTIKNVQVADDLNVAFAGKPLSGLTVSATPGLTVNPAYNGTSNTNLLMGTNTLAAGAGGRITLTVTVAAGTTLNYANQALATATDISGTINTSDLSDAGTDPDPNHNGDPTEAGENDPTTVVFVEHPSLTVTKNLVSSVKNTNGTFTLNYSITLENAGDVNLSGVQASDRLATAFPAPATFTVNSLTSSQFAVNGSYNGSSSTNLLAASQTLAAGAQGVINLTVTVNRNGGATVNFTNQSTASASTPAGQGVNGSGSVPAVLEIASLSVTKQVTALVPNGTNFSVTMRIDVRNSGDVTLTNVQASDDLDSAFSGVQSFTITSKTASGLTLNTNYNGVSDINLLVGTNSLSMGSSGSVFLTVSVIPGLGTSFQNQSTATGTSTSPGGETVTATSDPVSITPSLVQGTLYLDNNTNGVFDAGDEVFPYVDIAVTSSSNVAYTVSSDSLGHFVALVPAGSTIVNVNQLDPQFPTNATLTVGNTDPKTVTVPAGGSITADTGYVLPAGKGVVNGYLYLDNDGDGLYDVNLGDTPIANVDVQIIDKNSVTNTVSTESHGYFLKSVSAGQAIVDVVTSDPQFPAGQVLTINDFGEGSDPTMVTVPDGGIVADYTGYVTPDVGTGEVIGIVYIDRNTNGVFDVADSPLTGLSVIVTDTNAIATTLITDPSGFYNLVVDAGLTVVNVDTNDPAFPTGATVTVGTLNPRTVNVPDGGTAQDNKGFRLPTGKGLVSGVIYIDENNNGLYEPGVDTVIPNVTVNITGTNGVVSPVVTDVNGFYSLVVTNGITVVDVDSSDPDFPAELSLTTNANGEGTDPTAVLVPNGGSATDNTGYSRLNHIPAPVNDFAGTLQNVPVSGNVLTNDYLGDTPISSLTIVTNGAHGTAILNLDGSYTYTPNPLFSGTDSFIYQLCDANNDCAQATVTITVTAVNAAPVAFSQSVTNVEDTALPITLTGSDVDGPTTNFVVVTLPTHGTLTGTGANQVYTPATNYFGVDSFTFTVFDGSLYSTGLVSITVSPVNDAPIAFSQSLTNAEDTVLPITLTGSDVDGPETNFVLVTLPSHGTLTGPGANQVYMPATNYFGVDSFTFTVNDGSLTSAVATVSIMVAPVNDAPVAEDDAYSLFKNTTLTVPATGVLTNDSDVDGDSLAAQIAATTTHGSLTLNPDGSFTYTPSNNYVGPDSFTYRASDGITNSGLATVSLTIAATNTAPVAVNDNYTTTEDTVLSVPVSGVLTNDTDVDGNVLTAAVVTTTTNGVLTLNLDGSFTYQPNTNFSGGDSFTYRANDGFTNSGIATVSITINAVNDAPVADNQSVTTPEDTVTNLVLTASDVDSTNLVFALLDNPTNGVLGTLNTNTGAITYSPATNYVGGDSFTFTVFDGSLYSTGLVSIMVSPVNDAPIAFSQSLTNAEDTVLPITLTGSDVDGPETNFVLVTLPSHGTLTGSGANQVYAPATNYFGLDSFTFTVNDGSLTSAVATVSITVTPANDAPIAFSQSVTNAEDTALPITLTGSDVDGPVTNFVLVTLPTHGTLTGSGANQVYTPATNYFGLDSFTFTVNDGSLTSAVATVSITVTPANDAPIAFSQSLTNVEDTVLPITLTGSDVDGPTTNFVVVTLPTHGTLTGTGADQVYTPATNYFGADSFTFTVNDGSLTSAVATVSITVTPVNDEPVAVNDAYSLFKNTTLNVPVSGVLTNDSDADGNSLTAVLAATTAHGSLALNPDGSFTYTPSNNYVGPDSFTYRASDGITNSGLATVALTIAATNTAPVAFNDSYSTAEDVALIVPVSGVLTNDTDVDGDTLTAVVVTTTTNGVLTLNPNGSFIYVPNTNFSGGDSFTYRANDGFTNSGIATVSITINAVNDGPVANNQSVTTPEDTATNLVLTASDVDSTNLVFALLDNPTNGVLGTLNTNTGAITYSPATNYVGSDSFTFTVFDGSLYSTGLVSITVSPVNDAPIAFSQSLTNAEDTVLPITLTGSDVDGPETNFVLVTLPTHGTLTGSGADQVYTPATNYFGADSFTFTVNDGTLTSAVATVSITVTPANDAPIAFSQSVTNAEDTVLPITLTGSDVDGPVTNFVLVTLPAHGTLTGSGASQTYTPATNYFGLDSFTFTVNDGSLTSAVATVSITVTNVIIPNAAPIANNDSYSTAQGLVLVVPASGVLTNDTDADTNLLAAILAGGPAHGTLTLSTNGGFTYTPTNNFAGMDTFTYRANDGTTNSGTATVTIMVLPTADIAILKTGPTNGVAGSNMTYTITVTNLGPSTATNVVVNDLLPAGFTFVSAVPATATVVSNLVTWPGFSLANGARSNFTVTATSDEGGSFTNIAFGGTGTFDPNPTNNDGTLTNSQSRTVVSPRADVAIFKTGSTNIFAGGTVTYTITATNFGPSTATNVVVKDNLPGNVIFQSATGGYSLSNSVITWSSLSLVKGATTSFTVVVTAPASGSFTNIAASTAGTSDPNPTNNNGSASTSVVRTTISPVADVIVLLAGPTNVSVGDSFTYTITLTNGGPSAATGVVLKDTLPASLTFLAASGGGASSNNIITWPTLGSLANGGKTNFTITVSAPGSGLFTNIAFATAGTFDLNLTNNNGTALASQVQTTVAAAQFSLLAGTAVLNPQTGLYEETVVVTNTGSSTVAGVRLYVGGLRTGVTLYNAAGTTNGTPYVQYNSPVNPSNTVTFHLEFYNPSRLAFTHTLTAVAILPPDSTVVGTNGVAITKSFMDTRIEGSTRFVIEFASIPGKTYTIIYSDDLVHWRVATPSVTANANVTQWYDDGPPKTVSQPTSVNSRYYRVIAN